MVRSRLVNVLNGVIKSSKLLTASGDPVSGDLGTQKGRLDLSQP